MMPKTPAIFMKLDIHLKQNSQAVVGRRRLNGLGILAILEMMSKRQTDILRFMP